VNLLHSIGELLAPNIVQPIEAVGKIVGELYTSDDEKLTHEEVRTRLAMQPQLCQVELNKVEAAHRSLFVAGWRPAIGWVCAAGLAFTYVVNPLIQWKTHAPGPTLPTEAITTLVYSLLGLGALRTTEKLRGRAK